MTSTIHWRRRALAGAALAVTLALAGGVLAQDKPDKLFIASHSVHKRVATGDQGGDVTAAWQSRTGIAVEWLTFNTGPLHDRLFRELSLPESTIDVAFLLNTRAVPSIATLLEPLDTWQQRDPIEDLDDVFPGMREAMTFGGKLHAVPFRHATSGLHYNEALFAERGIDGPPRTIEELVAAAKKLTYTRPDGSKVNGFLIEGNNYPNVVDIARAWNGDFITPDYKVATTGKGMVNAIELLRDFYASGVLPKNWTNIKGEDVNTWMQTGRAAMAITSIGRNRIYNDPDKSQFAGKIKTTTIPISREYLGQFDVAPAKVEFWAMVIPKNSRHKAEAWSLIKEMLSPANVLKSALNGNGPVRASTYEDPAFKAKLAYADAEKAVLKVARVPLPAFDKSQRAADVFVEEMQAAVLGAKPSAEAMAAVARRVQPLLP